MRKSNRSIQLTLTKPPPKGNGGEKRWSASNAMKIMPNSKKVQEELAVYNSDHRTAYDFNSLCYDSSIGDIKYKALGKYAELKKICKAEWETWEEYRQRYLQPELPF